MRLCGVTTRFHRVTKLVSGHTVSSWMGGKRNRVVEGKGGWGRDGEEKSGGRRSWEEWVREREREGRKVWWMAPCVGEGWTAISSRRKKILGCIVFKDRGKRIEKARARLMFSYFRWRTRFRDTERCIQTMKHSCSRGDEKEGGERYRCSGEK